MQEKEGKKKTRKKEKKKKNAVLKYIHIYISPSFSLVPRTRETAPHPWIAPARNDSGTGERRPGVKTTRKAALGACRTTPGGGTRGCPKRGPGGPRAAEKPLRSRGDPRCSAVIRRAVRGVRAASQKHWGDIEGGRGVPPDSPWKRRTLSSAVCLLY